MDLGAYIQIEDLDAIAKANGIEVPRLRGYRMMVNEAPVSEEKIVADIEEAKMIAATDLCEADPMFSINPYCFCWLSSRTDAIKDRYLYSTTDQETGRVAYTGIKWDKLHGKKRKAMKYMIKQRTRAVREQFETWNKYAGKPNILYVHARIGGNNWDYYKNQVIDNPRFLEKVNDWWDSTYCDLYFFVNEI